MKLIVYGLEFSEYQGIKRVKAYQNGPSPVSTDRQLGLIPGPTSCTHEAAKGFVGPGLYEADVELVVEPGYGRENRTGINILGLKLIGQLDFKTNVPQPSQPVQPPKVA